MRSWLAISVLLAATTPGCASAIASALGATGTSAAAAADLDAAMLSAAVQSASAGGERHGPRPSAPLTTFGGEPSYVCAIPGDPDAQTLAASSLESAIDTCGAMNEIPDDGECACREAELGSTLPEPIARR